MKPLLLAAALLATVALPASAEDQPAKPGQSRDMPRPGAEFREQRKAMHEQFKAEDESMRNKHKAAAESAREDCRKRMEAATTPEARDTIMQECRNKADAMRKEFFDDRTQEINKRRAEEDKMRDTMRAKHEEMKAKAAPAAQ